MIIEPNSSEKFTGGDGQVWVSWGWICKQTVVPSTYGWRSLVMSVLSDTLGSPSNLRKNGVFYKLDDVLEAFKLCRNT